jgi:protein phosphatase
MRLVFARATAASAHHPERNEDALLLDRQRGLAAVFDGVGGSVAGEVAARLAAREIGRGWRRLLAGWHAPGEAHGEAHGEAPPTLDATVDVAATLASLVSQAHDAIMRVELPDAPGDERRESGAEDAATTAAVAAITRVRRARGARVAVAWVGDSRVYLLRANGPLLRLTSDDGLLAKLVLAGVLSEDDATRIDQAVAAEELSDLDQSLFNRRNGITQSVGGPRPPDVHVAQAALRSGDRLLLCTDGIHDNLTDRELEQALRRGGRTTAARALVALARERSCEESAAAMRAKPDDMTALVISVL